MALPLYWLLVISIVLGLICNEAIASTVDGSENGDYAHICAKCLANEEALQDCGTDESTHFNLTVRCINSDATHCVIAVMISESTAETNEPILCLIKNYIEEEGEMNSHTEDNPPDLTHAVDEPINEIIKKEVTALASESEPNVISKSSEENTVELTTIIISNEDAVKVEVNDEVSVNILTTESLPMYQNDDPEVNQDVAVSSTMNSPVPVAVEEEPIEPEKTTVTTVTPEIISTFKSVKCFNCTSQTETKCRKQPGKTSKQCPIANDKNSTGCFTMLNAETASRGCISELTDVGHIYCRTHPQLCAICFDDLCNKMPTPSRATICQVPIMTWILSAFVFLKIAKKVIL